MSEAIKKVIDFGFNDMRLKSLEAFTHKENLPSIKLLERNTLNVIIYSSKT